MSINEQKLLKCVEKAKLNSKTRNFVESIDLIINFKGIEMKKTDARLSQVIELPHGRGKEPKICIIARGELSLQAKKLGVKVLSDEEMALIARNKRRAKETVKAHNFFLVQSDLMPKVAKQLGRYLGPVGKIPIPFPATGNISQRIESLKKSVQLNMRKQPVLQIPVGTDRMEDKKIVENIRSILDFLATKYDLKHNLDSLYLKTTMGKPIKVPLT